MHTAYWYEGTKASERRDYGEGEKGDEGESTHAKKQKLICIFAIVHMLFRLYSSYIRVFTARYFSHLFIGPRYTISSCVLAAYSESNFSIFVYCLL